MLSPVPDYLANVLVACEPITAGEPATYIPELATVDPDRSALAVATVAGSVHAVGDAADQFTIQSLSKPFAYALAIEMAGLAAVLDTVDVEPSGEAFNEISLDPVTGNPRNPMINAGAIAICGMIRAEVGEHADERMLTFLSGLAGRSLMVNESMFESEMSVAHRNLAMGHLLAAHGIVTEPVETVRSYIRQCSIDVTVADLAMMAATLANGGRQPVTGEQVMAEATARQVLSVMATCGMYDDAGDWLSRVGIPAKSGVSGGIIGVLPGQVGIAAFSPRLDQHGNSARGVEMMRRLSDDMDMHLMNPVRPARSAIRAVRVEGDTTIYELHGDLAFVSAESLIRRLVDEPPETPKVVLDMRRVDEVTPVAGQMTQEAARRLRSEGIGVEVIEPEPEF